MKSSAKLLRFGMFSGELIYISSVLILIPFLSLVESSNFNDNFQILRGTVRLLDNNQTAQLTMDRSSGSGFQSKDEYLFGSMSISIKLIEGNSAGTVTTFYVIKKRHNTAYDEFCICKRKDAAAFWVDSIPIRVFKNVQKSVGIPYPSTRPMRIHASLWNGEKWATEGGRVKIDWGKAPFVTSYISFQVNGCIAPSNSSAPCANNWWEQPEFGSLNQQQLSKLDWVRKNYTTYDYCQDRSGRFPSTPAECAFNP